MSIELHRLRYRQGQLLRSWDFRDQTAMAAQLRWWHNRALHNSFGVSWGLSTTPVSESGQVRAVRVGCGRAYDCFGRELILQNPVDLEVPTPGQGPMTLLVRYKETAACPERHEVSGVCLPGHDLPVREKPDFVWKPTEGVTPRDGVPLARMNNSRVDYLRGKGTLESIAPLARPLARPRIAQGATLPGNTAWELWSLKAPGKKPIDLGFQVRVNTATAGFSHLPGYFARLQGTLWGRSPDRFVPVPFTHVDEPSSHGFVFRLWLPELTIAATKTTANQNFNHQFLTSAREQGLYVSWLGIESRPVQAEK
jgi:hypothetical protein